ncbi:transposon Ty3-I Gag-Pol polyprotein [Trichonephila clavipes]|nr:transposon Ty3-I Gag-Pol polyprotein [Trichonephila clavipes]
MSEVSAVQIPLYNISDPTLWFIMCESIFALATPKPITKSVTSYNYIVANLPPNTASLVRDILMYPDATNKKRTHKSFRRIVSIGSTEPFFRGRIRFSKTFRTAASHEAKRGIFECR